MNVALEVTAALLRESLRALLVPLQILWFLPQRARWRAAATRALAAPAEPVDVLAQFLAAHPPAHGRPLHLFLSAGEASGLRHAAALLTEVQAAGVPLRCSAFGGDELARLGARVLFPLAEHAVMGVAGVLRELPRILHAFATYLRVLRDDRPDLVVLVDYPGLHLVMAHAARRRRIPVVHYIAPQYWAAMPWRVARYRRAVDATLTILPFESRWLRAQGIPAEYVGHPLLGTLPPRSSAPPADPPGPPLLLLLPGSRRAEIEAHLPAFAAIAARLQQQIPDLQVIVAHTDARRELLLRQLLADRDGRIALQIGPLAPLLARATLALVKSGTGSLETALHGVPNLVVYRVRGALMDAIGDWLLTVPFIAMANLLAGRQIVPEFRFHGAAGWTAVEQAASRLLRDAPARAAARRDLDDLRARLGTAGAQRSAGAWIAAYLRGGEAG